MVKKTFHCYWVICSTISEYITQNRPLTCSLSENMLTKNFKETNEKNGFSVVKWKYQEFYNRIKRKFSSHFLKTRFNRIAEEFSN